MWATCSECDAMFRFLFSLFCCVLFAGLCCDSRKEMFIYLIACFSFNTKVRWNISEHFVKVAAEL